MNLPTGITNTVGRLSLHAKSVSPRVLFVGGIVGVGATVVLACRATLKVEDVLNNHDKAMVGVSTNKQQTRVYIDTSIALTRLYAPALVCGVVSVGALAGSHNMLLKRNAGLAAAYGTLDKAFKSYRERVREELGEDREREVYNDVQVCEIEDPSTGKKTKKSLTSGNAAYSYFFDRTNRNFENIPETNLYFLKMQQSYFNQLLQARGHLFLNEVLLNLGFDHTPEGAVTGWIKDEGDNYVDFGIFNKAHEDRFLDFMAGREDGIWLNFNVDGVIYKKI